MGWLDWMKRGERTHEPEPELGLAAPFGFTKRGNPITDVAHHEWRSDDGGLYEFRNCVGKSIEGYHGGLQVSYRGGDGPTFWTNARPNPHKADRAAYGIQKQWDRRDGQKTIWIGDVYEDAGKQCWAYVERNGQTDVFDAGIATYRSGKGIEQATTYRSCSNAEIGIASAKEAFAEWREEFGQHMQLAPRNRKAQLQQYDGVRQHLRGRSAKEPDGKESKNPSPAQSQYAGLLDRVPVTETEAKRSDALIDMTLVVNHMARDPEANLGKYRTDFEKAVSGMRSAFFQPEIRKAGAERKRATATPRDAEAQRESASPQQGRGGWTWER